MTTAAARLTNAICRPNAGPNSDKAINSTRPTPDVDATIAQNFWSTTVRRRTGFASSRSSVRPSSSPAIARAPAPIARMSSKSGPIVLKISLRMYPTADEMSPLLPIMFRIHSGADCTYLFSAAAFDLMLG